MQITWELSANAQNRFLWVQGSVHYFSFKYILKDALVTENRSKIFRASLGAIGINGLKECSRLIGLRISSTNLFQKNDFMRNIFLNLRDECI